MAARRARECDADELGSPPSTPVSAPVVCLLRSAGDLAAGAFVGSLVGYDSSQVKFGLSMPLFALFGRLITALYTGQGLITNKGVKASLSNAGCTAKLSMLVWLAVPQALL
ncbi:hypothetical protein PR202_gb29123 [Eleusine coracana subsp. coracana]|uniref:Uncharacterized protein n=1 Tax=Eleusine coracana subsp. coracana TaxID=191504 RepID=A0AAV5FYM2_ELECO|nr:hypothetical protein PR202_gb29123 [Eleusine coracana subsp. coracana]